MIQDTDTLIALCKSVLGRHTVFCTQTASSTLSSPSLSQLSSVAIIVSLTEPLPPMSHSSLPPTLTDTHAQVGPHSHSYTLGGWVFFLVFLRVNPPSLSLSLNPSPLPSQWCAARDSDHPHPSPLWGCVVMSRDMRPGPHCPPHLEPATTALSQQTREQQ